MEEKQISALRLRFAPIPVEIMALQERCPGYAVRLLEWSFGWVGMRRGVVLV